MHICFSVIPGEIFVACEDDACYEHLLNVHFSVFMWDKKAVRMLDGLRILHECKVIHPRFVIGDCLLKTFMQGTQGENAMLDGRFDMAKLQDLSTPEIRVEELSPLR